jgi:hypothetical protein
MRLEKKKYMNFLATHIVNPRVNIRSKVIKLEKKSKQK